MKKGLFTKVLKISLLEGLEWGILVFLTAPTTKWLLKSLAKTPVAEYLCGIFIYYLFIARIGYIGNYTGNG